MSDDLTRRLSDIEQRLKLIEDERDICRLISSYGPLVDGGAADEVAALWTEDGVYDVDEVLLQGQRVIATMVRSRRHQAWIEGGCAHFLSPPRVQVAADEAVAVCHSLMVVNQGGAFDGEGSFAVRRATAHHWALQRTPAGWRVKERKSRVLDGRVEARDLLVRGALGEPVGPTP